MKTLVIILFSLTAALCVQSMSLSYRDVIFEEWAEFKQRFGKQYFDQKEENYRMKVFLENRVKVAKHNRLAAAGKKNYTLAINEFSDQLSHEFGAIRNGLRASMFDAKKGSTFLIPNNVVAPQSIDWRQYGYVTPVKDQGQCGSCWAFSATGSLEGQHARASGALVSLSEQNLIDCSGNYGNNGCEGGLMDNAFKYIRDNGGIDNENCYPYEAMDDTCRFSTGCVAATDTGYVDIAQGDENQLMMAVATVGPVSVAIDASSETFQQYSGGVYDEPDCSSTQLDHGVLVVGYGSDSGNDYWIVKNSWGSQWGEQGYIRMTRNKDNQCGIASMASYPLV